LPGFAAAQDTPRQIALEYRISKAGITIGTVRETFTREDGRYRIVSETRTAGPVRVFLKDKLTVSSEGRIGPDGMVPERYTFRRERDTHKNLVSTFDWNAREILASVDGGARHESFELPPGTLDRVSAMYQFMFRAPQSETVVTWMSQGKKAEHYQYRRAGTESFSLAGREYSTVRFTRIARAGESHAELWLASDLHFLPVKMTFADSNGLTLQQTLVTVSLQ
jgi:Protein of unknown function (DUF3108)